MRTVIKCVLVMLGMTLGTSCKKSMKGPDYVQYVRDNENGLVKTMVVDGFEYTLQYRPYDYIVLIESKGEANRDYAEKRKEGLRGTAWFTISLKRADNGISPLRYGITSLEEYNDRLDYFLNRAKNDIWLLYGADTVRPTSYLFENNYNLTPQQTIIAGFYLPEGEAQPIKKMQLAYNDRVFKCGIIKATVTEASLKNIPNLELN